MNAGECNNPRHFQEIGTSNPSWTLSTELLTKIIPTKTAPSWSEACCVVKFLGLRCPVWRFFAHCAGSKIVKLYCYSNCDESLLHEVCGAGD